MIKTISGALSFIRLTMLAISKFASLQVSLKS
jgi:hypothetical protein